MFKQHMNTVNAVEPFLQRDSKDGEVYVPGEALTVDTNGQLIKCTGTTKPEYICQEAATGAVNKTIAVTEVRPSQILEVPLAASGAALKKGQKVTIGTDGLTVTATTVDGVFTITDIIGTAVGDVVRGVFK